MPVLLHSFTSLLGKESSNGDTAASECSPFHHSLPGHPRSDAVFPCLPLMVKERSEEKSLRLSKSDIRHNSFDVTLSI